MTTATRVEARLRRHTRVRKKVRGTPERPRLNVFRSASHIYAQVIDDVQGHTIVSASDVEKALQEELVGKTKTERAKVVGRLIAERAMARDVKQVVFDRGGYKYHGRVEALASAAREAGLGF